MRVLAHADPHVLEAALLAEVDAAQSADPLAPVLVVVPTSRLAAHVERRIAERLGTRVGVEVAHHRALAQRILEAAWSEVPEVATDALLQALLRSAIGGLRENRVARFVAARPGALAALHRTLRDLREAGIGPGEASRILREPPASETVAVYAAYVRVLEARAAAGLADGAVLVERAVPRAAAYASRFRAVIHHGAYELIGMHLDLVKALDAGCRGMTWLMPGEPGAPSARYAEAFARRHLLAPGGKIVGIEASRPAPSGGPCPASSAQGAIAEAEWSARLALRAVAEGARPSEVAILARALLPFTAALEAAFEDAPGIWDSGVRPPLRRRPEVRDFLLVVRAAAADFPRAVTAEALRSPCLRWTALLESGADFRGDLAEGWSRRAGLLGGLRAWTVDLPEWAEIARVSEDATDAEREDARARATRRGELAASIGRAIAALAERVDASSPRTWSAHADRLEKTYAELAAGPAPGASPLRESFEHLRRIETALGERGFVPLSEALDELERVVDQTAEAAPNAAEGGIRVLDAAEARGLTFDHVFLVGLNAGTWPRPPREDPFLDDGARLALRESTGRPIGVKREGDDEERLLLSLALHAARERVHVSWQHADEEGKAAAASPALREVARVLFYPDAAALRHGAHRVAAHPKVRLDDLESTGLLRPDEAVLRAALAGEGSDAAQEVLLAGAPSLARGVAMLRATESFAPGDGRYDGRLRTPGPPAVPSPVTAVERLGRCPLQFFFRHRLGIHPLEEEASAFGLEAADLGREVHALLERLYGRLRDEGRFGGAAEELVSRAEALFDAAWADTLGSWGERLRAELPVLHEAEADRWRRTVLVFVREDLARLASEGARPVGFERTVSGTLELERGVGLALEGRLDRVTEAAGKRVVADYKTSGNLGERADRALMLKGRHLQVPLYHLLARAASTELLGVGPGFDPAEIDEADRRSGFGGFDGAEAAGFRETLRVLADLDARGAYPLRYDERPCGWCDYRRACRRNHPPTLEREENADDTRDYRDLGGKSTKKPALANVRADREAR